MKRFTPVILLLLLSCAEPDKVELSQFVLAAIETSRDTPGMLSNYATDAAVKEFGAYQHRMVGTPRILGWDFTIHEDVCTVEFDNRSAFWFILSKRKESRKIFNISPVDLDKGGPIN